MIDNSGSNNPIYGKHYSEETKKKMSDAAKRRFSNSEDHPRWKGGRRISSNGYIEIKSPSHRRARGNGYVFEHILVAEEKLGRSLEDNEVVHHINRIKTDNSPENLEVITRNNHSHIHARPKTGGYITCPVCGKDFYCKPSHISKRTTCSVKCAGILFGKYYTGQSRDHKITSQEREAILCSIAQS